MTKKPKSVVRRVSVPAEVVERRIHLVRGRKVMLDSDLAALYEVETFNLNKAVKRNLNRFPEDFMFRLTREEHASLIFQSGISKAGKGGRRYAPYAFTEHGVAMLASVLNSDRAMKMSIQIIRAFVKLRDLLLTDGNVAGRLERLEAGQEKHGSVITILIDEIEQLKQPAPLPPKRQIGFRAGV
jgi:phage regulator Rha-like protein